MQFRMADLTSSALTLRVSIYFSLFYKQSREVIVSRITFASSTSETIESRHQEWFRSSFVSGFCLLNPSHSAPSSAWQSVTPTTGVELLTDTQCH
jgi:hypothetical protein